jgi:hypothetical protein
MNVLSLHGSPSLVSRSGSLLELAQSRLQSLQGTHRSIIIRDLPAEALLQAEADHPLLRQALASVARADVVLVAGKGHEQYQEVRGQRLPFSDHQQTQQALQARRRDSGVAA